MSMQTLTWDVDAAAVAGNSDAYSLALATQVRQKTVNRAYTLNSSLDFSCLFENFTTYQL